VGNGHACTITRDGKVFCWGGNSVGQLGDGTFTDHLQPVQVTGLDGVVAIAVGSAQSCALLADATVECWGGNGFGALGDGTSVNNTRSVPAPVPGLEHVTALSTGSNHTCALIADAVPRCWGWDADGQLGDGVTTYSQGTPVLATAFAGATQIAPGYYDTCALLADHQVVCAGGGLNGELGDGKGESSATPVTVKGADEVTSVAALDYGNCAVTADGRVFCWGNTSFEESTSTATEVSGLTDVASLDGGAYVMCALLTDGKVRCWGNNYIGQLGNGTYDDSTVPVDVVATWAE
jgi:alpha-tubulin suppressor-like RCC1 family protein